VDIVFRTKITKPEGKEKGEWKRSRAIHFDQESGKKESHDAVEPFLGWSRRRRGIKRKGGRGKKGGRTYPSPIIRSNARGKESYLDLIRITHTSGPRRKKREGRRGKGPQFSVLCSFGKRRRKGDGKGATMFYSSARRIMEGRRRKRKE